MTQQLTQYEGKRVVLMKSGLIHWVTEETGTKLSEHLANQSAHSFIRINELNITLNSAEMEGVYTQKQYEDVCRVKSGEWQCAYGNWHLKRGECKCKEEKRRQLEQDQRRARDAANYRELTPEEREANKERLLKMSEKAALNQLSFAMIKFKKGNREKNKIRRSTIEEWEQENGRKADLTQLSCE